MSIVQIAALSENRVIGREGKLPRSYPADLKRFKQLTMNSPIIMGRSTYESIGKALPGRTNIVVSSTKTFDDAVSCVTPDEALAYAEEIAERDDTDIYVIGGESIYTYFLNQSEYLYLTHVTKMVEGDRFYPMFEDDFEEIEREEFDEYDFVTWRRKW